jgi:hypothetical protein
MKDEQAWEIHLIMRYKINREFILEEDYSIGPSTIKMDLMK